MVRHVRVAAVAPLIALWACGASPPAAPEAPAVSMSPELGVTQVVAPVEESPSLEDAVTAGEHWRLETAAGPVHVWLPANYDETTATTVVYIHGFYTTVDRAWTEHRLAYQFAESGINAAFIACAAPDGGAAPVAWPSLGALLTAAERGTGLALSGHDIVVVGHSGAHRTFKRWLGHPLLDTLVRLDAAFDEAGQVRSWLLASPRHRLIDVAQDSRGSAELLHRGLAGSLFVATFPETELPPEAAQARAVYVPWTGGHMEMIRNGEVLPRVLRAVVREP